MKTRFLILTVLTSIIFIACKKEKESENPYNTTPTETKKYFFTAEERSLQLYNQTDSFNLLYDDYDTIQYFVKEINHDTLIGSDSKKYEQIIVQFERDYSGTIAEIGFISMSRQSGNFNYKISLSAIYPADNVTLINKVAEHYVSKTINNIDYADVYRIEDEAVSSDEHICLIKRAFISPERGIIELKENCHSFKIIE